MPPTMPNKAHKHTIVVIRGFCTDTHTHTHLVGHTATFLECRHRLLMH